MHLIMAFPSISLTLLTPFLTFGLGSTQSVSHCIPQSEEIGQIDRRSAFHAKKCGAIQLYRSRWNAHCMKTDFFKKGGSQNLIAPC